MSTLPTHLGIVYAEVSKQALGQCLWVTVGHVLVPQKQLISLLNAIRCLAAKAQKEI